MCVSEKANVSEICWKFDIIQCQHHLNKRIFIISAIYFHHTHSTLSVVSQIFHYAFVPSVLIGTVKLLLGRKLFLDCEIFLRCIVFHTLLRCCYSLSNQKLYSDSNLTGKINQQIWDKKNKPTKSLIKTLLLNTIK